MAFGPLQKQPTDFFILYLWFKKYKCSLYLCLQSKLVWTSNFWSYMTKTCFSNICETSWMFLFLYIIPSEKDIFLLPCMEKFAVKFQIYIKVIKAAESALVYDKLKRVFSFLKTFPENFFVKYWDKDLGYVNLGSPVELADTKSWMNWLCYTTGRIRIGWWDCQQFNAK